MYTSRIYCVCMVRRTTIEIDEDLLLRAKRALGRVTTRATVEEALRRAADGAEEEQRSRDDRQLAYLDRLGAHADVAVLRSEEMWR